MHLLRDLKLPSTIIIIMSAMAVLTSLTGLSFPFSQENKCPQRIFFQARCVAYVSLILGTHDAFTVHDEVVLSQRV